MKSVSLQELTFVRIANWVFWEKDHPILRRLEGFLEGRGYDDVAEMKGNEAMLCDVRIYRHVTHFGISPLTSRDQIEADSDLSSLVKQLRSHLESMQSNATQIDGIRDAIARTQASINLLPLE